MEDDIHYLIASALVGGRRSDAVTRATAEALLALHKKLEERGAFTSRNWPLRVGELFEGLVRRDRALPTALVASSEFGRLGHALFVEHLDADTRPAATRKLWRATVGRGEEPTSELIALAVHLPAEEARRLVERQWEHAGLRDAVVLVLAESPHPADRAKFVEALASPQSGVVAAAAEALMYLGMDATPTEIAAALRAYKQACALPAHAQPRPSLVRLLEFWTEGSADVEEGPDPAKAYVGWFEMFAEYYPHESAKLAATSGADEAAWRGRLAKVEWEAGSAARGREVFVARACQRCHEAAGHLGPELKGAVARMSRDDLFRAILDPNLDVSPTYHTTTIVTAAGQVYNGVIVYESPESTLLQTGPDTTVRLTNTEASSARKSLRSLMPSGLLDPLSDQQLSDLYAYLKTLAAR